ncbi:5-proFAR isomerase [Atractiella rhizophila]|nr:5-proFAR isomerase [Atractiella rhizophila]
MTLVRPCIDLHSGVVKQIVGSSLDLQNPSSLSLQTNFISSKPPAYYAELYKKDNMQGAHVIKLGPGNDAAAEEALKAWPGGLQLGGGITAENAVNWLAKGASKVIVTSYLFPDGQLSQVRLRKLSEAVPKEQLVIDLSCKRTSDSEWTVCINGWATLTSSVISRSSTILSDLAPYCSEFLIHSTSVEGLQVGPDLPLVQLLAEMSPIPVTYAGGARHLSDLQAVERMSEGKVDLTFGSALDIFGGDGITWADCVAWNHSKQETNNAVREGI